jgi:fibronectin-binding autotransporter adhesin
VTNPIVGLGVIGIESEWNQSVALNLFNAIGVDGGSAGTGVIISSAQISQSTGYQIVAGVTLFGTSALGVTGNGNTPQCAAVLPIGSSVVKGAPGLTATVINIGANPVNLYPNSGDGSVATINGQTAGLPVVIGVNTVTPFQFTPGLGWFADGLGSGQSGSIQTLTSQGAITGGGTSQSTATAVTQALANITTSSASPAGVTLPPAKAGMQIAVANNSGNTITVYGNGSDTIGGTAGSTGVSQATATLTLYICFANGAWLTK